MNRKKKMKLSYRDKRNLFLIVAAIFIGSLAWACFTFFRPYPPDPTIAAVRIKTAADNPDSPEVQKVLESGKAVKIPLAGCPNLCKVSDTLYRGAQPTKEGFENLKKLGIKTVVCLRDHHSDEDLLGQAGLAYVAIPMDAGEVGEKEVVQFLRIAADPNNGPVFVHCLHGADRTGTMVAAYRMTAQNWEADRAIKEMKFGGFGFHPVYSDLGLLVRKLDVKKIQQEISAKP